MLYKKKHPLIKEMSVRGTAFLFLFLALAPSVPRADTLAEQDLLVAMSLCQMGEWEKSQDLFKKAFRKDPSSTTIYLRMVRLNNLLKALGNPSQKAQKLMEEAGVLGFDKVIKPSTFVDV